MRTPEGEDFRADRGDEASFARGSRRYPKSSASPPRRPANQEGRENRHDRTPSQAKLLGTSLCAQLASAETAATRGNLKAKAKVVLAYTSQVVANTPIVFTAEQAQILRRLADAL